MASTPAYDSNSPITPLIDDDTDCVTGWAIRIVEPPEGLTPIYDADSPMVALVDENNCVRGWALRIVEVES